MRKRLFLSLLSLIMLATAASANSTTTNELKSMQALAPDEATQTKFALFLSSLIQRWGYEKPEEQLPSSTMLSISDVFLRSSVRQEVKNGSETYDLLYHVASDIYFLLKFEKGQLKSIGAVSGEVLSEKLVGDNDTKNYFETTLVKRPALFKIVAAEFSNIPKAEKMFSWFMLDEHESLLLQENIKSALELLKWGSQDPCRKAAQSYLRTNPPVVDKSKMVSEMRFYPSIGLKNNQSRFLAFADEETNRHFGFLVFGLNDTKTCKPTDVMKSSF